MPERLNRPRRLCKHLWPPGAAPPWPVLLCFDMRVCTPLIHTTHCRARRTVGAHPAQVLACGKCSASRDLAHTGHSLSIGPVTHWAPSVTVPGAQWVLTHLKAGHSLGLSWHGIWHTRDTHLVRDSIPQGLTGAGLTQGRCPLQRDLAQGAWVA